MMANRRLPSSPTRTLRGQVEEKPQLSERTYRCQSGGLVQSGDLNRLRRRPQARAAPGGLL